MNCPKCSASALETNQIPYEDRSIPGPRTAAKMLTLDQCLICGGLWFDKDELETYLDSRLVSAETRPILPETAAGLDHAACDCPRCKLPLEKKPARSNPRLTLDVCSRCQGNWVDAAELAHAEGKHLPLTERLQAFFGP